MIVGGTTPRERARSGDEMDVITNWRKVYAWTRHAGAAARAKRGIRRRERRLAKLELKGGGE